MNARYWLPDSRGLSVALVCSLFLFVALAHSDAVITKASGTVGTVLADHTVKSALIALAAFLLICVLDALTSWRTSASRVAEVAKGTASPFRHGSAITEFDDDRLRRSSYARRLALALTAYRVQDSVVVGITGGWGTGKSSVLNLAIKALADESLEYPPIVVQFNPWHYVDQENLIRQFFDTLSKALRRRDLGSQYDRASELIGQLAKGVDAIPGASKHAADALRLVGQGAQAVATAARDLDAVKDDISKLLAQNGRRIVVVMDDIDRLTSQEIAQVFQLVKAVADFSFVIYVLAFDDDIVSKALEAVQSGNGRSYLEKIVNVPLAMPAISPSQLSGLVAERLDTFQEQHLGFKWRDDKRALFVAGFVSQAFRTIRHLDRLISALGFESSLVAGEVNYADFIAVTALRLVAPAIYSFVRDNRSLVLETFQYAIHRSEGDEETKQALDTLLKAPYSIQDRAMILDLLALLFPRVSRAFDRISGGFGSSDEQELTRERRVASEKSFDVYFQFDVADSDVSKRRMHEALASLEDGTFDNVLRSYITAGSDTAIAFLERLSDQLDEPPVASHAAAIIKTLINLADLLPTDMRGFPFRLDGHLLSMQLVYQLARRIADPTARFKALLDAIESAQDSIYQGVTAVSVEGQSHGRDPSTPGKPDRWLVSDPELDELQAAAVIQIERWACDGRLAAHPNLGYIIYRWLDWGDQRSVSDYILQRIDDPNFVRLTVTLGRNVAGQRFLGEPTIDDPIVEKLVDPARLRSRLRQILSRRAPLGLSQDVIRDAEIISGAETGKPGEP